MTIYLLQKKQAMFWTRSDYFRALIDDHFNEGSWDNQTSRAIIPIHHVEPDIFAVMVSHIYSNKQQVKTFIRAKGQAEANNTFLLLFYPIFL